MKEKISLFSNVPVECVIAAVDVPCIYELPIVLHAEGIDEKITELLNIWARQPDLAPWHRIVERYKKPARGAVKIAVVGKYVHLRDSYKSLHEALVHGGLSNDVHVDLEYIDSEHIEERGTEALLAGIDAILVPGGFGDRGTEGKIEAIRFAREKKIPFFGICLGMQLAVVEFARHICDMAGANSSEFDKNAAFPVIDLMPDQRGVLEKGGTMRLGAYPCSLEKATVAADAYGTTTVSERHRHRYEVNNKFRERMAQKGLVLSGTSPDQRLVEMVELPDHPYFVGCQFHPEFKSRPHNPHPLFARFVRAALERQVMRTRSEKAKSEASTQTPQATPRNVN
jgi:CTP synthase